MTLVFDYDGTLHNTAHLYGCAFRMAYAGLVEQGYAPERVYTDEEMSVWLGISGPEMWRRFMPELPEEVRAGASAAVGAEMTRRVRLGEAVLYPNVPETLDVLKGQGWRMLILSNCRHAYMEAHREYFGLDRWFDAYYCGEDFGFIPKEDIFRRIQEQYPDNRTIIVGDRASDFRTGTSHGRPVVGCAYGFGTAEEREVCTAVIDSFDQLPRTLEKL